MTEKRNSLTPAGALDHRHRWLAWCERCPRTGHVDLQAMVDAGRGYEVMHPPYRCPGCGGRTAHVIVQWTYGDARDGPVTSRAASRQAPASSTSPLNQEPT